MPENAAEGRPQPKARPYTGEAYLQTGGRIGNSNQQDSKKERGCHAVQGALTELPNRIDLPLRSAQKPGVQDAPVFLILPHIQEQAQELEHPGEK